MTNEAELLIVDGNEKAALQLYQQAFQEDFGHFSKDYYNALLCAIKLEADSLCIKYAQNLVKRGVPIDFFNQTHLQFIGSKIDLPTLYRETETHFDKRLQDTISLMIQEDQQYRGDNLANQESIARIDSMNYARLLRLLKDHGYPSELLIGVNMMRNGQRIGTRSDFDILITHQLKNGHCELIEYLDQSLHTGVLNSEVFVTHATYCTEKVDRLGCFSRNQEVYFQVDSLIFTCDSNKERRINFQMQQS